MNSTLYYYGKTFIKISSFVQQFCSALLLSQGLALSIVVSKTEISVVLKCVGYFVKYFHLMQYCHLLGAKEIVIAPVFIFICILIILLNCC